MGQNTDNFHQFVFELIAGADNIDHAVLFQIFGALEAVRQFFPDGLFNNSGASKTDNAALFGNMNIAEHGKRG